MKAERVEKSRTILFDDLPSIIGGFEIQLNPGCKFGVEMKYTGDSNVWNAIVLDDCIIPEIVAAINAHAKPLLTKRLADAEERIKSLEAELKPHKDRAAEEEKRGRDRRMRDLSDAVGYGPDFGDY